MPKNLKLILIVIITVAAVYGLIYFMGMQGFIFAWVLNFSLMMFISLFTETLKPDFKSSWYEEKEWEKKGKIYESLGINIFRKILVWVGWEKLNKKSVPVEKNLKALIHLEYRTKQSELGHLIIFFIVLVISVVVALKYGIKESLWLLVLNILLNLYPVFLQRYNRPRLKRAIEMSNRMEGRPIYGQKGSW